MGRTKEMLHFTDGVVEAVMVSNQRDENVVSIALNKSETLRLFSEMKEYYDMISYYEDFDGMFDEDI